MTNLTQKTMPNAAIIEEAQDQFKEWLSYLNRLEDTISDAGGDLEQAYHERIAGLRSNLDDIEARLDDLKSSEPNQWDERHHRFQQASWNYQHSYTALISDLKEDEQRSAGWLEGFTDRPPAGSAGWLEGTNAQPKGSEGWVEGMAERTPKSEGWTEGYSAN